MLRKEALSSRERIRLALEHKETDRIPIAMVCSGINAPAYRELERYLQKERGISVHEYINPLMDIAGVGPDYVGPKIESGFDMWGVHRKPVSYGSDSYSEIDFYPLQSAETVSDLDKHRFPSTEWFDYSVIPERIASAQSNGEYCLMISGGNIFESSWYMRGFQQMFMDLSLNPELAHGIMERVTNFFVEHSKKILSASKGNIDLAFTADDIGDQRGLLVSLKMWEEFMKPYHMRLNKAIHEFGTKVIYHSDGSVMDAVGGLVDMGIDVLQALQFSASKMDPVELKNKYGDRLCFQGGVSVQTTLPFGSQEDVLQEVEKLITVLGKNGGYILGPSHAIQAGTPPENIVMLFDTARDFYPFRKI
jgi:uroporphyrinogen decarboxylase